jgi:hypothetical protein
MTRITMATHMLALEIVEAALREACGCDDAIVIAGAALIERGLVSSAREDKEQKLATLRHLLSKILE